MHPLHPKADESGFMSLVSKKQIIDLFFAVLRLLAVAGYGIIIVPVWDPFVDLFFVALLFFTLIMPDNR